MEKILGTKGKNTKGTTLEAERGCAGENGLREASETVVGQ